MRELFQEIYESLVSGNELAVATIISDRGSTPRTSGSGMVVYRDGRISGTIGGGIVEADVIQSALSLFKKHGALVSSYDFNQTGKMDDMDLVCGGHMQVLVEHVSADKENLELFGLMCEEMRMARPFLWVGRVTENGRQLQVDRAMHTADNRWLGPLQQEAVLQKRLNGFTMRHDKTALLQIDKHQYVVAPVLPPDTVYLIGAGHVSKEIALLTRQLGFRTLVFDDREDFANTERFPGVDGVYVCKDFAGIFEEFSVIPGSYIIIVTRGHRFDKEVLAQALGTEAAYIGMIGSRKKRKTIYQALLSEGFAQSALDQVHCPIGLSIAAETPAEIGVSVAAELIQHRASRKSHG
ncbi:MAG: hypothetical protein AMJ60_10065 [Desulfobacterales bacterium SG8_35]|nr:MAG: hypothetical protein AMJ60_10065 [Desulfobacterales bacterium SG8_35]